MKLLRDTGLIYADTLKENLRNLTWLMISISTPIMYLILFTPLLKNITGAGLSTGHVLDEFLPGILALMAFGTGISAGFTTVFQIMQGQTERLRVTPTSRLALLVSPMLAQLTTLTVFMVLIVAIGVPLGFNVHVGGLAVAWVLIALEMIVFSSFSVAIAFLTKVINTFAAFANGINLPLLLLSGVLLPMTLAPKWMQDIAHINPMFYVVAASRTLATGTIAASTVTQAFEVMIPLTIVIVAWATRIYRNAIA